MPRPTFIFPALAAGATLLMSPFAHADNAERFTLDETYRQECGECHVAYPPALLPAPAWRQVMRQLDRHYGVDASLDSAMVSHLTKWLETNAGTNARPASTGDAPRMTQTPWFRHEHEEAPQAARRNVGSMARCEACHRSAAEGDYSENTIRFPSRPLGGQP